MDGNKKIKRRYLKKEIEPSEKVVDGVIEMLTTEHRLYDEGMYVGNFRDTENLIKWFVDVSEELQGLDLPSSKISNDDGPSPALLGKLSNIFKNVSQVLDDKGKEEAGKYLLKEFELGKTTGRISKIMEISKSCDTDKEIAKRLKMSTTNVTNLLGKKKNPEKGTPRFYYHALLNPLIIDDFNKLINDKDKKIPFTLGDEKRKKQAEIYLNKTVHELLGFLKDLGGKEESSILADELTNNLILTNDLFRSLPVKPEIIRNHVGLAIKQAANESLTENIANNIIKITEKGLQKLKS